MKEAEQLDEATSDHNEGQIVEVPDYDGEVTQVPNEGENESTEVPNESVPEENEEADEEPNVEERVEDNQGTNKYLQVSICHREYEGMVSLFALLRLFLTSLPPLSH